MNQRIIELADRAVEDISSGPWNISDEFCIKFAELIVRECAEWVNNNLGLVDEDAKADLLKHFGVEE